MFQKVNDSLGWHCKGTKVKPRRIFQKLNDFLGWHCKGNRKNKNNREKQTSSVAKTMADKSPHLLRQLPDYVGLGRKKRKKGPRMHTDRLA